MANISSFIIRDVYQEIQQWKQITNQGIEHPLGFIIENEKLYIISESHYKMTPLSSLLFSPIQIEE
jgi:hypothetical protein